MMSNQKPEQSNPTMIVEELEIQERPQMPNNMSADELREAVRQDVDHHIKSKEEEYLNFMKAQEREEQ